MTIYRKALIAASALLLAAHSVPGEEPAVSGGRTLTLKDCISIAMTNATGVANARRDREIVVMQSRQARSDAFPQISIKGDYTRLDELQSFDMPDGPVELGILNNYSASLTVSQMLYSGGRVSAAIRASRLAANFADHGLAEATSTLIRDVSIDFFAFQLASAAADVQRESEAQLKLFASHTRDKFRGGTVSELDWLAADARYRNAIPARIAAENAVELARSALLRRIGVDADADYTFSGDLKPASSNVGRKEVYESAVINRRAIGQMEATVGLREERARIAKSGWFPTVSAFASLTEANSYGFTAAEEDWETHWTAGVTFEWSLFDGGLTRAKVREKRLEIEKTRAELEDLKRAVKLEVRQAVLAFDRAPKAIEAARGAVGVAEKALALATTRYDLGLATGLDVAEANVALKQARLSLVVAIHDQNVAVVRLKHASGITADSLEPEREK